MAEITKAELNELRASVSDLGTKLDSKVSGFADKLGEKNASLDNKLSEFKGAVGLLKWGIPISTGFLTLLLGLVGTWVLSVQSELNKVGRSVAVLESKLGRPGFGNGSGPSPAPPVDSHYYQERRGKIGRITKDALTLTETDGEGKTERTFPIAPGARVIIDGKSATLDNLKEGMAVIVVVNEKNRAELIDKPSDKKKDGGDSSTEPLPAPKATDSKGP